MKHTLCLILTLLILISLFGCNSTEAATTEPEFAIDENAVALTITGPDGTAKTLTLAEIKAMPGVTGWGGTKSSTGRITVPVEFTGVRLQDLWSLGGDIAPEMGINVVASDGYGMTFSYDQIINANLITYDPATGDEITIDEPLIPVLAYLHDGNPIDEDHGPLRIAVLTSKNNQVVDGHWAIKWVENIRVKSLGEDWSLQLDGGISETIDRATFESCSATGCHTNTWTDDHAQTWTGVPLWQLAGYVDDDNKHTDPAYREDLAEAGYTVEVIAADGYSVTFDSARLNRNNAIIAAAIMNGNPLDEDYFPLRLVGEDLQGSEMVGQITQIKLHLK